MMASTVEPWNNLYVTVAIPVYSSGATLGPSIRSSMHQTLRDLEALVADNASTDFSGALAEWLTAEVSDVAGLRLPENGGKPGAMSKLVEAARGKWIAVLDADDAFHDGRLGRSLEASGAARHRTSPSWPLADATLQVA